MRSSHFPSAAYRGVSRRVLACWVLVCAVAVATGCKKSEPTADVTPTQTTSSPDRLTPSEQLPGTEVMFGVTVPRGMKLNYHYLDVAQARGSVPLANLAEYFRKHVSVASIEMSETRAIFPRAYINGDATKRVFRIEIIHHHGQSTVKISDVTPTKAPEGLTEEQRWERAGLNPDGSQKNRLQVY